jgi:hypothetical protein
MGKIILILLISISSSAFCQNDTIFKVDGEVIPVSITGINEESILFVYPGESFSNSIGISSVSKIHFKSGRIQEFSSTLNILRIKSCLEWENVQISNIESEVKGLLKIDVVGAKAKGATALSSLAKLQDRAYNKIKIETAMLGGNLAYLIEQSTEESVYGGQYGGTKLPSVTISGLAYTSKKVLPSEIAFGSYNVTSIYNLEANAYEISPVTHNAQEVSINKEDTFSENNFQKINLTINSIEKVVEYTIIYADSSEIVLSGVYSTKNGKKTYYNVMLEKM